MEQSQPIQLDAAIRFPTLRASPIKRIGAQVCDHAGSEGNFDASMPPPSRTLMAHARVFPSVNLPERESVASDDSIASSAINLDSPPLQNALSRPLSATTLSTSRPSSIASNTSAHSQVQGQLTGCPDLLSPGLATALGLVSLHNSGSSCSSSRSRSNDPVSRSRMRAQSTQASSSIARRPSMPIVPSMHHRMSVASISSFDSLPEDETVNGFLAPTTSKLRAASYDRPPQLSVNTVHNDTVGNVYFPSMSKNVSTAASVPSSPTKRSQSSEDTTSLSSSSGHGHEFAPTNSVSPSSTISTSSAPRPSAFLRRSATAPGNPTDLTLLMARRKRSAKELLETERTFLASLTLIDQEYYQPLMSSLGRGKSGSMSPPLASTPILSRKSIAEIFANFPDIMQLNKELLSRLEERFGQTFAKTTTSEADLNEARPTWDPRSDCVGDILVTLAPFLKMYSLFVKNFSSALQRIESEQKTNEAFAKFLKSTEQRRWDKEKSTTGVNGRQGFGFGLGFQAHLLTIVQRIPRYKLLVDDLIKCTPQSHSDRHDLLRAGQVIEQVASYINDNVRQHEMMLTMLSLQKSLQGLQEPLVVPGRVLIKRGTLMKTCRRNIQPREFFLFTDCLMYASPISGGIESASAAWNALAQKGGLYSSGLTEQTPSLAAADPPAGAQSPIESVLDPSSRLDPRSRMRTMSLQEPYTPLAGAIFSLAGHQLQFRAKFPLRDCTVVGVEDSLHVGLRHCFEIRTPDKSFAVYAETATSKEAWVTGIREARADFMSARRTLKADEDSIEAKRERRRSLYKLDAGKTANRRLSTQSLGAYLAGTNLAGQDQALFDKEGGALDAGASSARTPQRLSLRSRVDSMPTLLRPPSFPSFPSSATNLSLANLLASGSATVSAKPLRILEDYNAPVWVPDNRADKCANCSEAFGIWRRKHHCRLCGQVVCWLCSQRSFLIPNYEEGDAYKPARACDPCYDSVFPADQPEESQSALADDSLPTSAEMTSIPSTDGSDGTALSAYRLDSDLDGGLGSPRTPGGEGSPGISRAESPLTDSSPTTCPSVAVRSVRKALEAPKHDRPKSIRFEDESLPPMPEELISATLPMSVAAQPSQEVPPPPMRSKSLYSPSKRTSMPGMPHRASALEAHLFTNHSRPQIQAATSGSGTFRLMTPRLTTPESELPPGQTGASRRSTFAPSIMTTGYFGVDTTCIPEGVEDPSTPTSTSNLFTTSTTPTSASPAKSSDVFRPSMMHAPNGVPPHLRSHTKRPMSAAARLSTFYGPMLSSERRK